MYAIIKSGGKQYRVQPGQILLLEKVGTSSGSHSFGEVLLVSDPAAGVRLGSPLVDGVSVSATVLGEQKGKKVIVFKKKRRKGYRRKKGHRQTYARVRIDGITG